ncbi:MAG: tRNA (N6-threonylcarbamoyladenosine(37)-N6)-methyltransferase TrmO [Candidatus Lokiarchaeota archaeon]
MKEYKIKPIGHVKVLSEGKIRVQSKESTISELIIDKEFRQCLEGIEDFSHLLVSFWPHLLNEEQRKIKKVYPRGKNTIPLKGVFATRSPARPNPILISVVEVLKREKDKIKVRGLDAINGTPLIDIKPYIPYFDSDKIRLPKWIKDLKI